MNVSKSTMLPMSMKDKRTVVLASIYTQTGQMRPNKRIHESVLPTDIDDLLNESPINTIYEQRINNVSLFDNV